jgi:hypothetical protein
MRGREQIPFLTGESKSLRSWTLGFRSQIEGQALAGQLRRMPGRQGEDNPGSRQFFRGEP